MGIEPESLAPSRSSRVVKRWLLEQPTVLTQREVIEIAAAANKPATWRPGWR